eukprot:s361_g11.t1
MDSNPQDASAEHGFEMPGTPQPQLSHGRTGGFRPFRSSRGFACMEVPKEAEDDVSADVPKDIPGSCADVVKDIPSSCAEHALVKSRFSIRNICCDAEVRLIERVIKPLPGVQTVAVNSFQKICIVEHCSPCCTSPETILSKLNSAGLGASLLGKGGEETQSQKLNCREWCQRYTRIFVVIGTALCMLSSGLLGSVGLDGSGLEILAIAIGLPGILWEAIKGMKQLLLDVTLLVALSVFAAAWHGELFDAGLVVLWFNLAKIIEAAAVRRVARVLRAVMQLQTVRTVQLAKNGQQVEISDLQSGDVIALRPGEQCPAEGLVIGGLASCSEAAMTGEATPHEKTKGAQVSSGTLVLNGYLEIKLTKASSESRLSEIEGRVQDAQAKRTERQMMISRFAQKWTPAVLAAALLTASMPAILGGGDYAEWRHRAIVLLLIACPCAIVIGAPLATTCAIAAAAAHGVLIKRPDTVERLPAVVTVGLDKTGTLTKGEMTVLHVQAFKSSKWEEREALKLAAALEMKSAHPIAAAIVSRALGHVADAYGSDLAVVQRVRNMPGVGIQGVLELGTKEHTVLLGSSKALDLVTSESKEEFRTFQEMHQNDTTVALIIDGTLEYGLALNDMLRPTAVGFVEELKTLQLRPHILTGDSESAAMHIAASVGLDPEFCCFSMAPEEKTEWVEQQQAAGRKSLMLGDGVNDATALAMAFVGVAIGETGAALAAQSADVVLLTDRLQNLSRCIRMCRYAVRIERLSIAIPCFLKLLQGFAAFYGKLDLWMAVLADSGTLIFVLVLGISILDQRFWKEGAGEEALFTPEAGGKVARRKEGKAYAELV